MAEEGAVAPPDIWRFDADVSPDQVTPEAPFVPPTGSVDTIGGGSVIFPTENGKYLVNITGGAVAVTLKDGLPIGSQFSVVQGGTGAMTISRSGTETINGSTAVTLGTQYIGVAFYKATASEWYAIGPVT